MKLLAALAATATVTAATACAHDIQAAYVALSPIPTGNIDVVLNDTTRTLSVTVNDTLVVDRKHTRKATITAVPAGLARVQVATGGRCEQGRTVERDVEVIPGATTTVALPGPEPNVGCMVFQGLYYVGLNIGLAAATVAAAVAVR